MKYFIFLLLLLTGCSLQRKQSRALKTVLANRSLVDSVGFQWSRLNPCLNDTTIQTKADTVIGGIDTLWITQTSPYIYNSGGVDAIPFLTRKIYIHDTIKFFIEDKRQIGILGNELIQLNDSLSHYRNVYFTLKKSEKEIGYCFNLIALALIRQWWFWVILIGFLIYLFRNKWISLISRLT